MAEPPILGKILRHHGGKVIGDAFDKAINTVMPAEDEKPSWTRRLGRIALLRIATKSVPGAIIVGGSIALKHLHNRHKAKKGDAPGAGKAPKQK